MKADIDPASSTAIGSTGTRSVRDRAGVYLTHTAAWATHLNRLETGAMIMIRIGRRSIRRVTIFLASISFAATLAAADIPPTEKGIRLFDGKSLEHFDRLVYGKGFNNDPKGVFRVHDGMVRVEGSRMGISSPKRTMAISICEWSSSGAKRRTDAARA